MPTEQNDHGGEDEHLFDEGGLINWDAVERRVKRREALRQELLVGSGLPADATLEEICADFEHKCNTNHGPLWFDFRTGGRKR
jgi:hypothetical protein